MPVPSIICQWGAHWLQMLLVKPVSVRKGFSSRKFLTLLLRHWRGTKTYWSQLSPYLLLCDHELIGSSSFHCSHLVDYITFSSLVQVAEHPKCNGSMSCALMIAFQLLFTKAEGLVILSGYQFGLTRLKWAAPSQCIWDVPIWIKI